MKRAWMWALGIPVVLPLVSPVRAAAHEVYGDPSADEVVGGIPAGIEEELAAWGEWLTVPGVGWVWKPSSRVVGRDFRPYATNGRWLWTDAGWYFDSDWSWGWLPFHYGRWFPDPTLGWLWVPGTAWAPAWVDWRFGGGFVGWAPLPPPGLAIGLSIGFPSWCFVPAFNFLAPDVVVFVVPRVRVREVFVVTRPLHETVVVGRARILRGPPVERVERVIGHPVRRVVVAPDPVSHGRSAGVDAPRKPATAGRVAPQTAGRATPARPAERPVPRPPQIVRPAEPDRHSRASMPRPPQVVRPAERERTVPATPAPLPSKVVRPAERERAVPATPAPLPPQVVRPSERERAMPAPPPPQVVRPAERERVIPATPAPRPPQMARPTEPERARAAPAPRRDAPDVREARPARAPPMSAAPRVFRPDPSPRQQNRDQHGGRDRGPGREGGRSGQGRSGSGHHGR